MCILNSGNQPAFLPIFGAGEAADSTLTRMRFVISIVSVPTLKCVRCSAHPLADVFSSADNR
jgi:hypothetical protein